MIVYRSYLNKVEKYKQMNSDITKEFSQQLDIFEFSQSIHCIYSRPTYLRYKIS